MLLYFDIAAQEKSFEYSDFALGNIKALTAPDGFSEPKWSPDGNKILFTKLNYRGLYVFDFSTNQIKELNRIRGAGFNAVWSQDSKNIYYRFKNLNSPEEVQSINIYTSEVTSHSYGELEKVANRVEESDNDTIIYLDREENFKIKAKTVKGNKMWDITNDDYHVNIIISPNRTRVVSTKKGEMSIYATDGSGLICSLGRGMANSWSPDGKYILFFTSKDDGHRILESDLYLIKSDGSQKWRLTETPDIIEHWPDWSPKNNQIVFTDIETGIIYLADLIKLKEED